MVKPRPLVKDPFALFSAEWFARAFSAQVVILVRHPAAFVSSVLDRGWDFPFGHWLDQEALLRDHLNPFVSEIEEYAYTPPCLMDQAILLWRAIYHVVGSYRMLYPSWLLYHLEDLALQPLSSFEDMYNDLGLELAPAIGEFVRKATAPNNPLGSEKGSVFDIRRDSRASLTAWRRRLSKADAEYIRRKTEDVWPLFYDPGDWE
jgi:hypothetical protein